MWLGIFRLLTLHAYALSGFLIHYFHGLWRQKSNSSALTVVIESIGK